jgi:hypothetical protein
MNSSGDIPETGAADVIDFRSIVSGYAGCIDCPPESPGYKELRQIRLLHAEVRERPLTNAEVRRLRDYRARLLLAQEHALAPRVP